MVNTRRMESSGSTPDNGPRHCTRSSTVQAEASGTSSVEGSESEESQGEEEESWNLRANRKKHLNAKSDSTLPTRVRELRGRFICNSNRKFSSHSLNERELRSRLTIKDRHSLSVYSTRGMRGHDDSFVYDGNDSEEEVYRSSRARRSRYLRSSRIALSQLEKRTALSLRPLSIKSYADPHSPLTYNSDDSDGDKEGVRRSTRKKTSRFGSGVWLSSGSKVSYANLGREFSDEDTSLDVPEKSLRSNMYKSKRSTRLPRELKIYNYEEPHLHSTRSRRCHNDEREIEERNDEEKDKRSKHEGLEKENKENKVVNDRDDVKFKVKREKSEDAKGEIKGNQDTTNNDSNESNDGNKQNEEQESSESEELRRVRTRSSNNLSRTRTRNRKMSDSSSSSEVHNRVYSLRQRVPKPPNNAKLTQAVLSELEQAIRPRRRRARRRKMSTSSDSDSPSDSDEIGRKSKYRNNNSKNAKGDHLVKTNSRSNKALVISPETLDNSVRFSSVGGLDGHVQCLKEMILLPMMYPEVFRKFQIQPPRGVLFHGPPGTGKTLIARALANECSFGSRKVSFFMRKGADLLCKWVGESEKQLRVLFEQAQELKPSIIFFDELDGLAPVRSSRQDQIHASIVSTLLALMDGLDNRGEVIVIGATNRIDAIDPALRRPGRFDRELFFPLPARKQREEILKVHVAQWCQKPSTELISYLAENAVGYCGSDLRALCSEAVIQSLRRTYPQVYLSDNRLLLDPEAVKIERVDFLRAKSLLVPASHRVSQNLGRKLLPILQHILGEPLENLLSALEQTFPHGLNPTLAKVKLTVGVKPAQLLLLGDGPQHGQTLHLAPAVLHRMEHIHAHILDLATLHRETARSPEEACIQVFNEAKRNVPSVIYIPSIDEFWSLVNETVRSIFLSQISLLDPNIPILILATASVVFNNLPTAIQDLFSRYRREVYQLHPPKTEERKAFFKPLLIDACLRQPKPPRIRIRTPPPLPRAPTPPPTPLTKDQMSRLYEHEEKTLRELRIFLRDMCKKLANNKSFYMFTKPVDPQEVPDYQSIIKQPMDLETILTKVDFHRYECAEEFLTDIELIVNNALEYNPDRTSADKEIRHRACSLRDYAHALIKNEMDSDFEDKCQKIAKKRRDRKTSNTQFLPAFLATPDNLSCHNVSTENKSTDAANNAASNGLDHIRGSISPTRKRRFRNWQNGYLAKKKKRRLNQSDAAAEQISEDDPKDTIGECITREQRLTPVTTSTDSSNEPPTLTLEVTSPLTVNCNVNEEIAAGGSTLPHSSESLNKLKELLSPSELLDDPLEVDDIDKALMETEVNDISGKSVEINPEELEKILEQAVKITSNSSLQSLLDLHSQLSKIVRHYARTFHRKALPKELRKELSRYNKTDTNNTSLPSDSTTS